MGAAGMRLRMKILTAEQMREVDRLTIEDGVPSIALMENAAHRVVEEMVREFDPIDRQSIVILCGKGNNGGDGLAIARLLHEYNVGRLRVVLAADPSEFTGDAAENLKRIRRAGHSSGVRGSRETARAPRGERRGGRAAGHGT